jgi:hypothetical protein
VKRTALSCVRCRARIESDKDAASRILAELGLCGSTYAAATADASDRRDVGIVPAGSDRTEPALDKTGALGDAAQLSSTLGAAV